MAGGELGSQDCGTGQQTGWTKRLVNRGGKWGGFLNWFFLGRGKRSKDAKALWKARQSPAHRCPPCRTFRNIPEHSGRRGSAQWIQSAAGPSAALPAHHHGHISANPPCSSGKGFPASACLRDRVMAWCPPLLLVGTPPFGEEGGAFLSKLGQVGPSLKAPREG